MNAGPKPRHSTPGHDGRRDCKPNSYSRYFLSECDEVAVCVVCVCKCVCGDGGGGGGGGFLRFVF